MRLVSASLGAIAGLTGPPQLPRAFDPRASASVPGPFELPGLGAPEFIFKYSVCGDPLGPILLDYRKEFGNIFTIKTGPIRQVWVADEAMVDEIYAMPACSGRSQLPAAETPFGEKFLFLKRDPVAAQPIRKEQERWMSANAGAKDVREAVAAIEPELFAAIDAAMASRTADGAMWPAAPIGTAILGALLGVFGGDELDLSRAERAELLASLAGYRRRANAPPNPFATKLDYALRVRELLLTALSRAGRTPEECEELLPLLVSACVGGGEIFPLLIEWTVRRLAIEPDLQVAIRTELATQSSRSYGSSLTRTLAAVMRQCPYSLAIGPPRKALHEFEYRGLTIPEGSLVFAMHPGVIRSGPLPPLSKSARDEEGERRALRMFGVGSRACTAAQTSLTFMCSALATILKTYEVTISNTSTEEELLRYKSDGSLLVPAVEVPLTFTRV
eukprot:CAMPEP_0174703368 /NCGR_PEP_ID=MMETSP1094-20130205/7341_1 /TAXON_ID=156173 /ORGANISM="Chrysochromulina brevifilum, Strain UTEX LB 985" /LENGTH=445 /DNA_ID=CAMNT_0015901281 /DNA_START=8 /DNA_END=1345 /DNA_ORIENTATION=-